MARTEVRTRVRDEAWGRLGIRRSTSGAPASAPAAAASLSAAQRSPSAKLQSGKRVSLEARRAPPVGAANVKSNDDHVLQLARAAGVVGQWLP